MHCCAKGLALQCLSLIKALDILGHSHILLDNMGLDILGQTLLNNQLLYNTQMMAFCYALQLMAYK